MKLGLRQDLLEGWFRVDLVLIWVLDGWFTDSVGLVEGFIMVSSGFVLGFV